MLYIKGLLSKIKGIYLKIYLVLICNQIMPIGLTQLLCVIHGSFWPQIEGCCRFPTTKLRRTQFVVGFFFFFVILMLRVDSISLANVSIRDIRFPDSRNYVRVKLAQFTHIRHLVVKISRMNSAVFLCPLTKIKHSSKINFIFLDEKKKTDKNLSFTLLGLYK